MRLFLGVPIDGAPAEALAQLLDALRRRLSVLDPDARLTWVTPERLHFTIRFIGEVDPTAARAIETALSSDVLVPAFDVQVGGVAAFPAAGRPRGLWVGVEEGGEQLVRLERAVSDRLRERCGLPAEDRAYRPHVTLARLRRHTRALPSGLLEGFERASFGSMQVDAITLFESRLSPAGPSYVSRHRFRLGAERLEPQT